MRLPSSVHSESPLRRRHDLIAALVLLLCPALAVHGLDPSRGASQYAYHYWSLAEGLPQNTVRAMAQTPEGLLWLSTHAGLHRFDGVAFTPLAEPHEILSRFHVYSLATDHDGALWIGTNGGGLLRRNDGTYTHFSPDDGFPGRVILDIAIRGDRVWIATESDGVIAVDGREVRQWSDAHGLPAGTIHNLAVDQEGACWAAVLGHGLFRIGPDGEVVATGLEDGLLSSMPRAVHADDDGTLWVGFHRGFSRLRQGEWRHWTPSTGFPDSMVSRIRRDRDGNLWIATLGSGLLRLSADEETVEPVDTPPYRLDDLWALLEDRSGSLWLGTLASGLGRLSDGRVRTIGAPEGLAGEQLNSLAEGPDGTIWATTNSSGLQRLRGRDMPPAVTSEHGLSSNGGWGLAFDSQGDLWVATMRPGLDHISASGVRTYTTEDGIGPGRLLGVYVDRRDRVWVTGDSGLVRLDPAESPGAPRRLRRYTTADGLAHDQTGHLSQALPGAEDQRLWIGGNGGVSVWDEDDRFANYTAADGLINERVWSIAPDGEGGAWIGTFGGGLHRLRDGKIRRILGAEHGLPSNDVTAIVDDGAGYAWLATTRGLARLPWHDLRRETRPAVLVLDSSDGMRSAEIYGGSPRGIRASDGHLYFVSRKGFSQVDPSRIDIAAPPKLSFHRAELDGKPLHLSSDLVLAPSFRRLAVSVVAESVALPSRVPLRYRLVGLEKGEDTWLPLAGRRVELSRLPPGEYTLEVEAADAEGTFHENPAVLAFTVEPRFRDTKTFALLTALLFVAAGVGAQQWRVRLLRARQAELQAAVDEAVAKVRALRGLLPICASCKNIRDDEGYWQGVETYITEHADVAFSHGLCPTCSETYLREFGLHSEDVPQQGDG